MSKFERSAWCWRCCRAMRRAGWRVSLSGPRVFLRSCSARPDFTGEDAIHDGLDELLASLDALDPGSAAAGSLPRCSVRRRFISLRCRLDPEERRFSAGRAARIVFDEHVEQSVRALTHVADALLQLGQQALPSHLFAPAA